MSIRHDILIFPLIKLLRGIDKVDITIGTVLFENDNRSWNAGIKERYWLEDQLPYQWLLLLTRPYEWFPPHFHGKEHRGEER